MSDPAAAPWKHAPGEPNRPHPGAGHPDPRSRHAAHRPCVLEIAHNPAYAPVCSEREAEASSSADVRALRRHILMRWMEGTLFIRATPPCSCNSFRVVILHPTRKAMLTLSGCQLCGQDKWMRRDLPVMPSHHPHARLYSCQRRPLSSYDDWRDTVKWPDTAAIIYWSVSERYTSPGWKLLRS